MYPIVTQLLSQTVTNEPHPWHTSWGVMHIDHRALTLLDRIIMHIRRVMETRKSHVVLQIIPLTQYTLAVQITNTDTSVDRFPDSPILRARTIPISDVGENLTRIKDNMIAI